MICRNISKTFILLLAAICSVSCNDNIQYPVSESSSLPIALSAAYPSSTRASDAGFDGGDQMGVYVLDYISGVPQDISADDINAANIRFDFNATDNSWKGSRDIFWRDGSTPADIVAYYPYSSGIDNPTEMVFSVKRHQESTGTSSSLGGYEASDLLHGEAVKQMPSNNKVELTLTHMLAGVRISLVEGKGFDSGEWAEAEKIVTIPNTILTGTVNLKDGSVMVGALSPEPIVPLLSNGDYRAVVFPQTIEAGIPVVSVSINGVGYNLLRQEACRFTEGRMHVFTITVDKRSDGGYLFSPSDEAIVQWLDDAEFRDGLIRSYTTVDITEKGTLKDVLLNNGLDYKEISNLKLTGEINEEDFFFMRDEMSSLRALNLKDVTVYDGYRVNVLPARAMYNKTSLSRIVFPKGLKIIGTGVFYRSGLLGDLVIPEGVEKIGESFDFDWSPVLHGYNGVFSSCENLMGNLSLPSTLTHIEHAAFYDDKLEGSLILPKDLKFIGDYAFYSNNYTEDLNIPESVEYIGNSCFCNNQFSGSLELPTGTEIVRKDAFRYAGFSGSLILPEGILEIQNRAFEGCGFRGEMKLPSSLLTLGDYVFCNTKISNIVFPKDLISIGNGCFMNCVHLCEKIVIPENVVRINEYTFAGDILLSEVEFHENLSFVGGAAFASDYNLSDITIKNPVPPYIGILTEFDWLKREDTMKDPFYEVPLMNVTLKVPEGSREAYERAEVWRNIGRHSLYNGFGCRPERICALNKALQETIIVDVEGEWEISHIPSWCEVSEMSGTGKAQVTVTISEMPVGNGNREDYVEFRMTDTDYTTRCSLSQMDYTYQEDECIVVQKASKGRGIDILFVGEGFDAASIANGDYLKLVNEQAEAFFNIEPYSTYKEYFNVYACISLSQETGVSTTSNRRNTRFLTRFDNGYECSVKGLACDSPDQVFDYAIAHSPLTKERMPESLIIMTLNSDQYGSVSVITESGSSISIVGRSSDPYPMDTRGMLQHEACGHAFGKLAEERISENKYIGDSQKKTISKGQLNGWYQNISLTGKLNEVSWAELIFDPRYSNKVDVFEGGFGVTRGVYRAEINSCMNYGIPYFSAAARLDIMRRILEYSGEGFTMEKFYATDSDKWGSIGSTRATMPEANNSYVNSGKHHPVRIVKSKKY